jgi:hypothetical protein
VLNFALDGDLAGLRLPDFDRVRHGDRLWEHSCFEAFVAAAGEEEYLELNFAPSGAWAAYRFTAYRQGMTPALGAAPEIAVCRSAASLEVAVRIGLGEALPRAATLRLGLCAVIEDASGGLSYWALRHAPGKPDFHRPAAFALCVATGGRDLDSLEDGTT